MQAGKGYSLNLPNPPITVNRPLYFGHSKVVCAPYADGSLRISGTMELSGLNNRIDLCRIGQLERGAVRHFAKWQGSSGVKPWMGMRPLTPDGLPAVGQLGSYGNAYVSCGHGTYGMTMAAPTAMVLANRITGGPRQSWEDVIDPSRFA